MTQFLMGTNMEGLNLIEQKIFTYLLNIVLVYSGFVYYNIMMANNGYSIVLNYRYKHKHMSTPSNKDTLNYEVTTNPASR